MSFFAILCALLIEQVRPLAFRNPDLRRRARLDALDQPQLRRGQVGIMGGSHGPFRGIGTHRRSRWAFTGSWCSRLGLPFAVLWSIAVLYVTLGFRQFSHHFTGIRDALDDGDEPLARSLLAHWQRVDAADLPRSEIVRHVIEHSVIAAHRHVFGVLAWFSILAALRTGTGRCAVFYRMSEFVARYWAHKSGADEPAVERLGAAGGGSRAWGVIDWLPARITALGFAVVGSFEEAIDCWRNDASRFPDANDGVILAATSGAVNVRLGGGTLSPVPITDPLCSARRPAIRLLPPRVGFDSGSTPGREPEPAHICAAWSAWCGVRS